jgi:hypothetical protein
MRKAGVDAGALADVGAVADGRRVLCARAGVLTVVTIYIRSDRLIVRIK